MTAKLQFRIVDHSIRQNSKKAKKVSKRILFINIRIEG